LLGNIGYSEKGYKNFILIPISFVNEHIETLHELDIEYGRDLAKQVIINIFFCKTSQYFEDISQKAFN